jgi:predicted nucleic acid-binding protein
VRGTLGVLVQAQQSGVLPALKPVLEHVSETSGAGGP